MIIHPIAHAKVENVIFDVWFPGNRFVFGIISNDFCVVKLIPKVETDQKEMTRISSIVEDESTEGEQNPIVKGKVKDA